MCVPGIINRPASRVESELSILDRELGVNSSELYAGALAVNGAFRRLSVTLTGDDHPGQIGYWTEARYGQPCVSLSTKPEDYRIYGSPNDERSAEFKKLFNEYGTEFTPDRLIESIIAHEFGHADYHFAVQKASGGSDRFARDMIASERTELMARLPLGMSTSRAEELWRSDEAFRRNMKRNGVAAEDDWGRLKERNSLAYKGLYPERHADRFALNVLRRILDRRSRQSEM